MTLGVSTFSMLEAIQTAIGGILRGAGKLIAGAATYLVSYYVVGVPIGFSLALLAKLGIVGQWIGLVSSSAVSLTVLSIYFLSMNWQNILKEAETRLRKQNASANSLPSALSEGSIQLASSDEEDCEEL